MCLPSQGIDVLLTYSLEKREPEPEKVISIFCFKSSKPSLQLSLWHKRVCEITDMSIVFQALSYAVTSNVPYSLGSTNLGAFQS